MSKQQIQEVASLKKGFDALADHVVITDANGVIVYANAAVEKNTGFSVQEVLGKKPGDLWGGKMSKEFYQKMYKKIAQEKEPFVGEVQNVRKDGTAYWQELHISPLLDAKGNIKFFIAVEPNITDRKERENFKKEFLFETGRQITEPLSATVWIIEWLLANRVLEDEDREALHKILENNRTVVNIFDSLAESLHDVKP